MDIVPNRVLKLWVAIGYIAVAVGVIVAHNNPATHFVLDIYASTPTLFWIGTGLGIFISFFSIFLFNERSRPILGLFCVSVTAIVLLPILRGIHFVGRGDGLTHLGLARGMITGTVDPSVSLYPSIHLMSIAISSVTGNGLTDGFLLTLAITVLLFVCMIPLIVRIILPSRWSLPVGLYSGALILPLDYISVSMSPHPSTQAILFVPTVVLSWLLYYHQRTVPSAVLVSGAFFGLNLIHPQHSANILFVLGSFVIAHLIDDRADFLAQTRNNSAIVLFSALSIFFWTWGRFRTRFDSGIGALLSPLYTETTGTPQEVVERSSSLSEIGSGPIEIFFKLFFIKSVFVTFTILVLLIALISYSRSTSNQSSRKFGLTDSSSRLLLYMGVGCIPVALIFLFLSIGSVTTQYFRYIGFLMSLGTMFGAVFIAQGIELTFQNKKIRTGICIGLSILLLLSLLIVFPSPYISRSSAHVPESHMDGYDTIFNYSEENLAIKFTRTPTGRFWDALEAHSLQRRMDVGERVPDHFYNQSLHKKAEAEQYLAITDSDRTIDVNLYDGFRWSRSDYEYLGSQPGIEKVTTSGGVELYYVQPTE